MAKRFEIRNSTAEFLIFMAEGKEYAPLAQKMLMDFSAKFQSFH